MSNERDKRPRVPGDTGFDSEFKDAVWKEAEYDVETYHAYLRTSSRPAPGRVSSAAREYAGMPVQRTPERLGPAAPPARSDVDIFGGMLAPTREFADQSASSVFDRATKGVGKEVPYRAAMEKKFSTSFSDVESFTGRNELRDAGANAAAKKDKVAFVSSSPSEAQVGHELTHVVQQRSCTIDSVAASRDVSEPNDAAEREADVVAADIAENGHHGAPVIVRAAPTARVHLDRGAVDVVSSAGEDTTSRVDAVSGADARSNTRQTSSASKLPKNATDARRYLEAVVVREGLDGIDNVLAQLQILFEGKPPIGDTSPHILGRGPDELGAALALLRGQANIVKREAYRFIRSFKSSVKDGAIKLLDVSEVEIASALGQYGLKAATSKLVRSIAGLQMWRGNERAAELALMLGAASRRKAAKNPSAPDSDAQNQADLSAASKELQTQWTTKIDPLLQFIRNQQPKPEGTGFRGLGRKAPEFDLTGLALPVGLFRPDLGGGEQLKIVKEALRKEKNSFTVKWLKHERNHPLLAMYRDKKGTPNDLSDLQQGREEQQRAIVRSVLPKLRDIYRTRSAVRDGKLDPLKLPAAVLMTKRSMKVRPQSMQDRLGTDEMKAALKGEWKDWAIAAVSVGLVILTAIPSGGSSLVLGAEIAGLALDLYLLDETIDDYSLHKAASNTNMDKARALSQRAPSLTWLVVDLLSVGLGAGAVAKAIDGAVALKTAIRSGDLPRATVIRDGLNDLGAKAGKPKLGEEVERTFRGRGDKDALKRDAAGRDGMHTDDVDSARKRDKHDRQVVKGTTGTGKRSKLADAIPPPGPGFDAWWDALSEARLDALLKDTTAGGAIGALDVIGDNIRHPGLLHEWLMVAEIRRFKTWEISMSLIREARTLTAATIGKAFRHGGTGSGTFHNELRRLIKRSSGYEDFIQRLNRWADDSLHGSLSGRFPADGRRGRYSLPEQFHRADP